MYMTRAPIALLAGLGVALVALTAAGTGRADPSVVGPSKAQCIAADTAAQSLRVAGKFAASRAALKTCVSASCPPLVKTDCVQRLDELDRAQPSLVIEAKDDSGADLSGVAVFVDGIKIADRVGGEALAVDPGEYDLRFETEGAPPVTHHVIVREGEHGRREAVLFSRPGAHPLAPSPVAAVVTSGGATVDAAASPGSPGSGRRTAAIAVGATGVAFVAMGLIFGSFASTSSTNAKNDCASSANCPDHAGAVSEHSIAEHQALVSTVGVVAGAAGIAGGVLLLVTAPKRTSAESAGASLRLVPNLAPGMGGASLRGTF
jgi:hypothetical protein